MARKFRITRSQNNEFANEEVPLNTTPVRENLSLEHTVSVVKKAKMSPKTDSQFWEKQAKAALCKCNAEEVTVERGESNTIFKDYVCVFCPTRHLVTGGCARDIAVRHLKSKLGLV